MLIRRAEERDIDRIQELLYQVCMVHHVGRPDLFKAGGRKYTKEQLGEILRDGNKLVLVAAGDGDRVLGYAFCLLQQHREDNILTDIRTLYLDDLCVDADIRGKGIGSALYGEVVRRAGEMGCYNLTLNVWSLNEGAMRFYEKCGLKPQKVGLELVLG